MAKTYQYKVYNTTNTFLKIWDDVVSEPDWTEEVNTAGSQQIIKLGRPLSATGEGTDVVFDNLVQIYCVDDDAPSGVLVFTGKIANYTVIYESGQEGVAVTILSYGADLNNYIVDAGDPIQQLNMTTDFIFGYLPNVGMAQSFTPAADMYLNTITVRLKTSDPGVPFGSALGTSWTFGMTFFSGDPNGLSPSINSNYYQQQIVDSSTDYKDVTFTFGGVIHLSAGTTYRFEISGTTAGNSTYGTSSFAVGPASSYTGGKMYSAAYHDVYTDSGYDLWFKLNGGTSVTFTNNNLANVITSILDMYILQGGRVTYAVGADIDVNLASTLITYTFNGLRTLESIKKCVEEFAPAGYYWFVDPTTNHIKVQKRNTTPKHNFTIGKDIVSANFEKRIDGVVNVVYVIGAGDLYKRYERVDSVNLYGRRSTIHVDQRISDQATMDIVGNGILDAKCFPEVRATLVIADSNGIDSTKGYDLEYIVLGDMAGLQGFGGGSNGATLWDISQWDDDLWDFDVEDPDTYVMQIVRAKRGATEATLQLSTIPIDITKRVDAVDRRLTQSLTISTPAAPTT